VANAVHAHDAALARLQELADLAEETARLEETIALNREMGQLLSVSGFERWLVQSALDDLLARATDRLFELSAGQFSLESEDGEFSIRDHRNADEVRNVRTLSGGETFLASLALALALAESIADLATEGGPRLESMFLDEGFGTLDPDTLDIVATTMEELSASGRLIGIVTHIRDLADRMPVRFEVHKDATTARVERVEV
jgi:exonuclease SbcC